MKTETTVMKSKALFSDDGEHRLLLRLEWDRNGKCAMIIMINPNTADTLCMDMTTMLVLNNLHTLDDIGCFVVLEKDEISAFVVSEMEFVEVLEIGGNYYLHGVRILGDSYGEDIYLPVEVVQK